MESIIHEHGTPRTSSFPSMVVSSYLSECRFPVGRWGQDRVEKLMSWSPDQLGVVMEGPELGVHVYVEWMLGVSLISPAEEV